MTPTGRGARSQEPGAVAARERLAEWSKAYSDQVVDGVLFYRDKLGLKNADLIARLSLLGWDLTQNTLAGILGKKRSSMPVTDVMLFAAALNIPPTALIFATQTNDRQRIAPTANRAWKPYQASKWFSGSLALPVVDFDDGFSDVADDYYEVGDIVSRAEEIELAIRVFTIEHARLVVAVRRGEDASMWMTRTRTALEEVAEGRRYLRVFHPDAALPEIRADLAFIDEPKRKWPELPLPGYTTEEEVAGALDAERALPELPADVRDQMNATREALLDKGTSGGEA